MPLYDMENCKDGHVEPFFYLMKDAPSLGAIVKINGETWKRIILAPPMAMVKDNVDPFSSNQFVDKTNKKDTVGSLFERSAELSEKRAKQSSTGRDAIKDKYFDKWSKKRAGRKHPADDRPLKK